MQNINLDDKETLEKFKERFYLDDEQIASMKEITILSERHMRKIVGI